LRRRLCHKQGEYDMASMDELREGVRQSLPEIAEIADKELADKVVEAYAIALSETEYTRLEEMSCSGMIGLWHLPGLTQADHLRGVGKLARAMALEVRGLYGDDLDLDPDFALAAGLLHDLGKPFFYDSANIKRWNENKAYTGQPPFRHTFYGAHLALRAGLPEEIAHVIAGHDTGMEGQFFDHSVYLEIVSRADGLYWTVPIRLGMADKDPTETPAGPVA
jgi:putative nucleotidyltransferase with HDIG domain